MASLRTLLCGVCVVLYTVIVVLHCIGVYLLWKLRSVRLNQYVFLINLSTVEIFAAINHSTYVMLSDFVVTENGLIYKVFDACRLVQVSGIAITWSVMFLFLTFDRFLAVRLNLKYEIYITSRLTKRIVFLSYLVGFLSVLTAILMKIDGTIDPGPVFKKYVLRTGIFAVMGVALCTYIYIYIKYRQTRKRKCQVQRKQRNVFKLTNFIPFWILVTFFLFLGLPEFIMQVLFTKYNINVFTSAYYPMFYIIFSFGFAADFFIYVFLIPQIRRRMLKMFNIVHHHHRRERYNTENISLSMSHKHQNIRVRKNKEKC